MIVKLAIRNLLHDRARFFVTLVGVLFAVVLLAVQLGLYLGARKMIVSMIEHTAGDLWIAAYGANSFEQASILTGRERFLALSAPGVASVTPLVEGVSATVLGGALALRAKRSHVGSYGVWVFFH